MRRSRTGFGTRMAGSSASRAAGAADFAGGTVVHINAGVAGLVCALVLGRRVGYGQDNMAPYNLAYAVIGASLLWVGWFGFNAGSAVGAGGRAGMAMLVTQVATAAAALAWLFAEWAAKGKPSVLGAISGAVAGLVAITPASGFVLPVPALIIGIVAGVGLLLVGDRLKHMLGYDDSLDAFGVHGVGGIVGALLTGVFAYGPLSATADHPDGVNIGGLAQFEMQCIAVVVTLVYSGVDDPDHSDGDQGAGRPAGRTPRRSARASISCCTANRCSDIAERARFLGEPSPVLLQAPPQRRNLEINS